MAKTDSGLKMVEMVIKGFEKRLAHRRANPTVRSEELFYESMISYNQKVVRTKKEGNLLGWVGLLSPTEIFYAMDIVPFAPELHGMLTASQGGVKECFDASAGYGLPIEMCSNHKLSAGMAINQLIPAPDFIISSQVCDSSLKTFEVLSHYYNVPTYYLDFPYPTSEQGIDYYIDEIQDMIRFLEDVTGRRMDMARLQEVATLSKKTLELCSEISDLRKNIPSPMKSKASFRSFTVQAPLSGTQEAIKYFETLKQELAEDVARGKGAVEQEKHRIAWLCSSPLYAMHIFDWLEQEYKAVVVMDMLLNYFPKSVLPTLDPAKPIEYLARKSYAMGATKAFGGPIEYAAETARDIVNEYKADSAVFYALTGCKQGCSISRFLRDTLQKELGVPTLIIDGDSMDPSVISPEEIMTKLEGYFEALEG
jgi:benzoyl-CoA reductase/2-hydroxyglutaryl-CoA dehydratase subunit BcrC/BadD/HgdB